MTAQDKPAKVLELPKAGFPLCNRVLSLSPFPPEAPKPNPQTGITPPAMPIDYYQPLLWEFGKPHPFIPDLTIVRMYVELGVGVEVYCTGKDGKTGSRNTLPWHLVKMTEELMDPETFVSEIAAAEEESSGGEPEPEPQPNGKPATAVAANGGA